MFAQDTKVLIIDDDPAACKVLNSRLKKEGFQVLEARSGAAALQAVAQSKPNIALLDLGLPDIDGLDILGQLCGQKGQPSIPVVILSIEESNDAIVEAMNRGAADYLVKGQVTGDALCRTIGYALFRHQTAVGNQRLIQDLASRNREILQLTSCMTHDLQAPLASLTGSIDSLRKLVEESFQSEKCLNRMDHAVGRMTTMLDDLMTYARVGYEEIRWERVDLEEMFDLIIEEAIPAAVAKDIQIAVRRPLPGIEADPKQLFRVFTNLVDNAIKFTPAKGSGRITISASEDHSVIRFRVADTGAGIAPSQLEEVLLPFRQATPNHEGSGIGLATVQRIIQRHGGHFWLESDGHSGTTAHVELPTKALRTDAISTERP